jgi:hypothetical protein
MDREAIFTALFVVARTVSWGGQTLRYTSRRVRLFCDLPALPALCQAEHDEVHVAVAGLPPRRTLGAAWMIHHATADPDAVPASLNNAILDAVEAALAPDSADGCCTLGGLVAHCWIEGEVFKDPGDLDGQALLIVPIRMLVP